MIGVNDNMPIGAMNIGELKALLVEILQDNLGNTINRSNATAAPKRYVYGIKGIEELFGCSHATAQHYKDTILADAVTQNGRKIVVDVELAMQLFGQNKKKGGAL